MIRADRCTRRPSPRPVSGPHLLHLGHLRSNDTKGTWWLPIVVDRGIDGIKRGVSRFTHGHFNGNGGIPLIVSAVHLWLIPYCCPWQGGHGGRTVKAVPPRL